MSDIINEKKPLQIGDTVFVVCNNKVEKVTIHAIYTTYKNTIEFVKTEYKGSYKHGENFNGTVIFTQSDVISENDVFERLKNYIGDKFGSAAIHFLL